MPKLHILMLLFLHILHFPSYSNAINATNFIKSECKTTLYPSLCVKCLSIYSTKIHHNKLQLAQAALWVSLKRAQAAARLVSKLAKTRALKPMQYRAVKDCVENMGLTVDQLSRSLSELSSMRRLATGRDFEWHVSNVETWVSAALTYENTCLEGFSSHVIGGVVKVAVRRSVVDCAQVTSNALALVNRFAAKH